MELAFYDNMSEIATPIHICIILYIYVFSLYYSYVVLRKCTSYALYIGFPSLRFLGKQSIPYDLFIMMSTTCLYIYE